jgi:hypothetical protein
LQNRYAKGGVKVDRVYKCQVRVAEVVMPTRGFVKVGMQGGCLLVAKVDMCRGYT